jgi:hypothetical protein
MFEQNSQWNKGKDDMDGFTEARMRAQTQPSNMLIYGLQLSDLCIRRQRPNMRSEDFSS